MTTQNVIAEAINLDGWTCEAHEPRDYGECEECHRTQQNTGLAVLDALSNEGYRVVKVADIDADLAAMAEWQKSALIVIAAANEFIADCVAGDGDPRTIAKALIDSGFDGRSDQ